MMDERESAIIRSLLEQSKSLPAGATKLPISAQDFDYLVAAYKVREWLATYKLREFPHKAADPYPGTWRLFGYDLEVNS